MTEPFDPYRKWLGIPPRDQPPNHYRLLGIATFENDPDVIENAATRQMAHVRTFKTSKHAALSQRILTELAAAKMCLLVPEDKARYDAQLHDQLLAEGRLSSESPLGDAGPAEEADDQVAVVPELPPMPAASRAAGPRWKTEATPSLPPPVPPPIPIPLPVGTAVAAPVGMAVEAGPVIRRGSSTAYRTRKKQSAAPMMMVVVCLLLLAGVGIVVAVVMNSSPGTATTVKHKPPPAHVEKATPAVHPPEQPVKSNASTPVSSHELPSLRKGLDKNDAPATAPNAAELPGSPNDPSIPVLDRARQQLFQAQTALAKRDDETFLRQLSLAEQTAVEPRLDAALRGQVQEEIEHLGNLKKLIDQFWATVGENLRQHIQPGETLGFFRTQLKLVSLEGEMVEVEYRGVTQKTPIRGLDPIAAALVAAKTAKIEQPATLIPILAFLSIDDEAAQKHAEDHLVKFARKAFSENRLAGPRYQEFVERIGLRLAELPLQ